MSPSASDVPDSVGKTSVGKDANVKRLQPHRSDVNPSQWGVAALAVSEPFKTQNHKHKPAALRWDRKLKFNLTRMATNYRRST